MTADPRDVVETECTVRTVPLGGSLLSQALQRGDDIVQAWRTPVPRDVDEWRARIAQVRDQFDATDWLSALRPAFSATGPAATRLMRASAAGVVVTTGQQPGLFGGPTYTWSKAISALAFADELEAATGVPVAPVFWAATDDADWMEAAITYVAGSHGLEELRLAGAATEGVALSEVRLGDTRALLDRLRAASGSAAYARVLDVAEASYVPHGTIGDAYLQLMRNVLEPLGIAVLDASHPATQRAADGFLRRALRASTAIVRALGQRTAAIEAAGFSPQVDVLDALSLVFRTTHNREGVPVRERVPVADAMRVSREAEPGTLGSNVLLRPVLERTLLPTVAYHAGPGELAYFAQVGPVAHALDVAAPLAVPRWSAEIIERTATRKLAQLGLDEASLISPHEAEHRIARAALDDDVIDSLERLRLAVETQVRALGESASRAELAAAATMDGLQRDLGRRIDRMERRLLAATKRRETTSMRDLAIVRALLRPQGKSPERVLNFLPFLVRYGPALLSAMHEEARVHARRLLLGTSNVA